MPANAGIQVRFQFTIKNRLDSGFRRNDDNNSRLQSPNSESLGLVMIQQPGCISEQLLRGVNIAASLFH
jgi:hypothetical protein